uniref:Uncharacterized protein n=1 Tax=Acrobeloides nanus TaxID=290746 RepID=A0A914D8C2_9BILA
MCCYRTTKADCSSTSTTTTTCFTTTTPIPCTCPTGTLQIFVTSDVTAALVDPMCNEPVSRNIKISFIHKKFI